MDRRGWVRLWLGGAAVSLAAVTIGFVSRPGLEVPVSTAGSVPVEATTSMPTTTSTVVDSGLQEGVPVELGDPPSWESLSESPLTKRWGHSGVWTGEEVIFWGGMGFNADGQLEYANGGAAYRPSDDSWRVLSEAPIGDMFFHSAVWTGSEMLIFGGRQECCRPIGAAYNPSTDEWRALPALQLGHDGGSAVWTGTELIAWGGTGTSTGNEGAAFDPVSEKWREIARAPGGLRSGHSAVWTGFEMLIFGGSLASYDPESDPNTGTHRSAVYSNDGLAYDPLLDTWRSIPAAPISRRGWHTAVWTGTQMIVWGGQPGVESYSSLSDGAVYDLASNSWSVVAPSPLSARSGHLAVWTEHGMLIWGGSEGAGRLDSGPTNWYSDGAIWDPILAAWYEIPPTGTLDSMFGVESVWAAGQIVFWGQFEDYGDHSEEFDPVGERFVPAVDGATPYVATCQLPDQKPPVPRSDEVVISLLFHCGGGESPDVSTTVYRKVPLDELVGPSELVLRALLEGPTLAERQAGVVSAFGDATADALIESFGIVITTHPEFTRGAGFNFDPSIFTITNNVFGDGVLFQAELFANLFQDSDIDLVNFEMEGSCVGWPEYLESVGCQYVMREDWHDLQAEWRSGLGRSTWDPPKGGYFEADGMTPSLEMTMGFTSHLLLLRVDHVGDLYWNSVDGEWWDSNSDRVEQDPASPWLGRDVTVTLIEEILSPRGEVHAVGESFPIHVTGGRISLEELKRMVTLPEPPSSDDQTAITEYQLTLEAFLRRGSDEPGMAVTEGNTYLMFLAEGEYLRKGGPSVHMLGPNSSYRVSAWQWDATDLSFFNEATEERIDAVAFLDELAFAAEANSVVLELADLRCELGLR